MIAGNWYISVRAYRSADGWTRKTLDTPSFIMGGISGQAMTRDDALANLRHMWPMDGAAVTVNADQISHPRRGNRDHYYITIYAADVETSA